MPAACAIVTGMGCFKSEGARVANSSLAGLMRCLPHPHHSLVLTVDLCAQTRCHATYFSNIDHGDNSKNFPCVVLVVCAFQAAICIFRPSGLVLEHPSSRLVLLRIRCIVEVFFPHGFHRMWDPKFAEIDGGKSPAHSAGERVFLWRPSIHSRPRTPGGSTSTASCALGTSVVIVFWTGPYPPAFVSSRPGALAVPALPDVACVRLGLSWTMTQISQDMFFVNWLLTTLVLAAEATHDPPVGRLAFILVVR